MRVKISFPELFFWFWLALILWIPLAGRPQGSRPAIPPHVIEQIKGTPSPDSNAMQVGSLPHNTENIGNQEAHHEMQAGSLHHNKERSLPPKGEPEPAGRPALPRRSQPGAAGPQSPQPGAAGPQSPQPRTAGPQEAHPAAPESEPSAASSEAAVPVSRPFDPSGAAGYFDFTAGGEEGLLGVRVQHFAEHLRVAILTAEPTPYVVTPDPGAGRARLELIGLPIRFFPFELNQLGDPRLRGIWLSETGETGTTLEFRLGEGDVRIVDFAVSQPPAIVLDFFRTGDRRIVLPGARATPPATAPTEAETETRDETAPAASDHGESPVEIETASPASESESPPGGADEPQSVPEAAADVAAERRAYDGFPIDLIEVDNDASRKIFNRFLNRQWATALYRGLSYLEEHPRATDLGAMLYLTAEARYQLGHSSDDRSQLDQINFFDQALLHGGNGELAAFAHWRIAGLYRELGRPAEAAHHLRLALPEIGTDLRDAARLALVEALTESGRGDRALELARQWKGEAPTPVAFQLEYAVGKILQDRGDLAGAWAAFERATALDPEWPLSSVERAERFTRVAEAMGEIETARRAYESAVYLFADEARRRPAMFLAYADLMRRLGDEARENGRADEAEQYDREAVQWYRRILDVMEPSAEDGDAQRQIRERLRNLYGRTVVEGAAGYARFLLTRRHVADAMAQLRSAWEQGVMSSVGPEPLRAAVADILEPYMSWAVRNELWHEAIGAWETFGSELAPGYARNACLSYLAQALGALHLDEQAVALLDQLMNKPEGSGIPTRDFLFVLKAESLNRLGRGEEAVEELERLTDVATLTNLRVRSRQALVEIYLELGRRLEAAQAMENLARNADLSVEERGRNWLRAAGIYLEEGLTRQAVEIGLRALIFEEDRRRSDSAALWPAELGNRLRLALAQAYGAQGDYERGALVLEDLAVRGGLDEEARGMAQYLLGEYRRRLGEGEAAARAFETARTDEELPDLWRRAAEESAELMQWEKK